MGNIRSEGGGGENVNLLEWQLLDTDRLVEYQDFFSGAVEAKNERTINNVRYMMALADSHNQGGASDQYMVVGGMAVLANISLHLGEYSALKWRDSHDLDIICRNRGYEFLYKQFFDHTEVASKSLAFGNKFVYMGHSYDINDFQLDNTNIDVYVPGKSNGMEIIVNKTVFGPDQWKNSVLVDYFGIPVRVVDPVTLMSMKLDINWGEKTLRKSRDLEDIINLLGVIEGNELNPRLVCDTLTVSEANKLSTIVTNMIEQDDEDGSQNKYLLTPSMDYLNEIIEMEVKG